MCQEVVKSVVFKQWPRRHHLEKIMVVASFSVLPSVGVAITDDIQRLAAG